MEPGEIPQGDPIAFFFTWPTYGTWLPGDKRGWVEYHHGWQLPDPVRELEAQAKMTEDACRLSAAQREIVARQARQTCEHRGWVLHAVNCRSNHMHLAIGAANIHPKKIRGDIKAWCTRRLREQSDPARENWWAARGSQRFIYLEARLERVILYATDGQERKLGDLR